MLLSALVLTCIRQFQLRVARIHLNHAVVRRSRLKCSILRADRLHIITIAGRCQLGIANRHWNGRSNVSTKNPNFLKKLEKTLTLLCCALWRRCGISFCHTYNNDRKDNQQQQSTDSDSDVNKSQICFVFGGRCLQRRDGGRSVYNCITSAITRFGTRATFKTSTTASDNVVYPGADSGRLSSGSRKFAAAGRHGCYGIDPLRRDRRKPCGAVPEARQRGVWEF